MSNTSGECFFVLKKPESDSSQDRLCGTETSKLVGDTRGDAPRCPECGGYVGMLTWLPPYRVELETWGKEFGDFAFFSTGSDILVSERFKLLFQAAGLTGLSGFQPVEVVKVRRHRKLVEDPPQYYKAQIVRSHAAVDAKASGSEWAPQDTEPIVIKNHTWGVGELDCPVCLRRKGVFVRCKGTIIESDTWSGEDIFIARGSSDFLVTQKFKDFCIQYDMKNVVFIPAETYGTDFYPSWEKQLARYLRIWENKDFSLAKRRYAYQTIVLYLRGDSSLASQGKFNPDVDIDPELIAEARRRIAKKFE